MYATARRVTVSEDNGKEATSHMVRACDKNGGRTITAESATLSYRRQKKSGSITKNMDGVQCIKEDVAKQDRSIQQAVELARDRDAWRRLCRHHHYRKMMEDNDRRS